MSRETAMSDHPDPSAVPVEGPQETIKPNGASASAGEDSIFDQLAEIRSKAQASSETPGDAKRPLLTPAQAVAQLEAVLKKLPQDMQQRLLGTMHDLVESDWLDADTWAGIGYVLKIVAETQWDTIKRRMRGDYSVDEWGYDEDFANLVMPIIGFLFSYYWRVEITGVEAIPNEGRALLVSNHSGVLPMDGAMISYGVREYHPAHRLVRALVANWFPTLPFASVFLSKTGQVTAHPANGNRLLEEDKLVLVFPEGYKGVGKLFRDRYKLARFGRGGYVRMALETQTPIFPVSVVGAEETYPMLTDLKPMARLLGFPFFPITPFFPFLGPLGFIPIPSKWYIDIGEPIDITQYDPALAANPVFVSELSDLIRNQIQEQINARLAKRKSVLLG
jgi:1-acyl-sn-glycerol-3-phosphate acyltransferase